ncbi:MAG: PilZ domain-containing protein [Candidatus Omnitrophica bacterium]|nr:PilZ domain-containing protein [Candidatus Omnitrophota bacterium]
MGEAGRLDHDTRKHQRVGCSFPALVEIDPAFEGQVKLHIPKADGEVLDLSRGGAGLRLGVYLPRGVGVVLNIRAAQEEKGLGRAIAAKGRVVLSRMVAKRNYRVGVEFTQIQPEDVKSIEDWAARNQ